MKRKMKKTPTKTSPFLRYRQAHGLTQDVIAELSGATRRSVSSWDGGRIPWPLYRERLIRALAKRGISTDALQEAWQ